MKSFNFSIRFDSYGDGGAGVVMLSGHSSGFVSIMNGDDESITLGWSQLADLHNVLGKVVALGELETVKGHGAITNGGPVDGNG